MVQCLWNLRAASDGRRTGSPVNTKSKTQKKSVRGAFERVVEEEAIDDDGRETYIPLDDLRTQTTATKRPYWVSVVVPRVCLKLFNGNGFLWYAAYGALDAAEGEANGL